MALTIAQAATLTNSMLLQGVVETIVNQSAVLKRLPFMDVIGSALAYPQETALASAAFNVVGGTWAESTPTFAQQQEPLKILGGDADVDNFLKRTYAATNDIEAVILEEKAKAVAYTFSNYFFNGNPAAVAGVPGGLGGDANAFAGLHARLIGGGQNLVAATNGATLSLSLLDQLIDSVKPGVPDVLYMSRRTRRQLNTLRRATGSLLQTSYDQFGQFIMTYDGIPVEIDDFIRDDATVGTSGAVCQHDLRGAARLRDRADGLAKRHVASGPLRRAGNQRCDAQPAEVVLRHDDLPRDLVRDALGHHLPVSGASEKREGRKGAKARREEGGR